MSERPDLVLGAEDKITPRGHAGRGPEAGQSNPLLREMAFFACLTEHPTVRLALFLIVFAIGLAVRVYRIEQLPIEFHPTRQFRSAIIARAMYYATGGQAPSEELGRIAVRVGDRIPRLEPPLMEAMTCGLYHAFGRVDLAFPAMLSILFWTLGGICLGCLARSTMGSDGALVAVGYFMLLPFGVQASRSFQPDPAMVACITLSWWMSMRYDARPGRGRFAAVMGAAAAAIFIKPFAAFFVIPPFFALAIGRLGLPRALQNRRSLAFLAGAVAPGAFYVLWGLVSGSAVAEQAHDTFLPRQLLELTFWSSWLQMIDTVVGLKWLIVTLLACLAAADLLRALLLSSLAGYVAFSLFATYHTPTHDYYQLALIPIVALGAGQIASVVTAAIARARPLRVGQWGLAGVFAFAMVLYLHGKYGMRPERDDGWLVADFQKAAAWTGHSTKIAWLDDFYGYPFMYLGYVDGISWPTSLDRDAARMRGRTIPPTKEMFDAMIRTRSADYFVVLSRPTWQAETELQRLLKGRYPMVETEGNSFIVFDLRPPAGKPTSL